MSQEMLAYLQRRMTLTFTPSSGGLALRSAMLSRKTGLLQFGLFLVGDLLLELIRGPLAARTGRRVAGSTLQAA